MTSAEHHVGGILKVRRPLAVKASLFRRLPAQAAIALVCSNEERLKVVPRHPFGCKYTTLIDRLLCAGVERLREVVRADFVVDIVFRERCRDVMGRGGEREVWAREEEDWLNELGRETLNWRQGHCRGRETDCGANVSVLGCAVEQLLA